MDKVSHDKIVLNNFPMPPSTNGLTKNKKSGKGRAKTETYKIYEGHVQRYKMLNFRELDDCHDILTEWIEQGFIIGVNASFHFKRDRLFSKQQKLKTIDTSNFLKALHDVLSKILGVDDKYFKNGSYKTFIASESENVSIEFKPETIDLEGVQ